MDAADFHQSTDTELHCTFPACPWHATFDPWLGLDIALAAHTFHYLDQHADAVEAYELLADALEPA